MLQVTNINSKNKVIGICDSGLGGIYVLEKMLDVHPNISYIYIGDQIHAPLGDKTYEQIKECSISLMDYFNSRGVDEVILACNTMCSTVYEELVLMYPNIKIHSLIKPTIEQLDSNSNNILVLATNATISSHSYLKAINNISSNYNVSELATPEFVPLIESVSDEDHLQNAVNMYLKDYVNNIDTIILGCTHYPMLKPYIYNCKDFIIYDSNDAIANSINSYNNDNPTLEIYTTKDEEEMREQIKTIFNKDYSVKYINLTK